MKILSIYIKNTKRIEVFNCHIEGNNLVVAGPTGTGKTTAVSALWEIMQSQGNLLKNDADGSGDIRIELGRGDRRIIAHRHFTNKTNTISVSASDSGKITPKDFRDMISDLSVNPHNIVDMAPTQQINMLIQAADLQGYDLQAADKEIEEAEQERLSAHRDIQKLQPGDPPEKVEAKSFVDVAKERDEAMQRNAANREKREKLKMLQEQQGELETREKEIIQEIEEKQQELQRTKTVIEEKKARIEKGTEICAELEDEEISDYDEQIKEIEFQNEKAAEYKNWQKKNQEWEEAKAARKKINDRIEHLRNERKEALEGANWPLEGLSIQEGTLLYNDIPVKQLGKSEQMLVCAALAIHDVKKHPIHVVRMDGIESMSKEDFAKLCQIYADADIQVLSTRVAREEVEDGEIEIVEGTYKEETETDPDETSDES